MVKALRGFAEIEKIHTTNRRWKFGCRVEHGGAGRIEPGARPNLTDRRYRRYRNVDPAGYNQD